MKVKSFNYIYIFLILINFSCKSISFDIENKSENEITISSQLDEDSDLTMLNKMSKDQKKGLLTMVSITDTVLSENTVKFLKDNNIQGIVLFAHNIINENQLKKLTSDIRNIINKDFLIAIDQEGGTVNRISWDKNITISARNIGLKNDYDFAYKIAYEKSKFLLDLGVNVILGPVCDIAPSKFSYMYDRSFGTDSKLVAKMIDATVKAQKDAGIITVLKHFPGLGKTNIDSHLQFPIINSDIDLLYNDDFLPFIKGIESGAEMVMIGHIINNKIDPNVPASLSMKYIDLLNKLDFKGIVITDDLSMTGKIPNGIGWGINLISGDYQFIKNKMLSIEPSDLYCERLLKIKRLLR